VQAQPPEREPLRHGGRLAHLRRGDHQQPVIVAALQAHERVADDLQVRAHPVAGIQASRERRRVPQQVAGRRLLGSLEPPENLRVVEVAQLSEGRGHGHSSPSCSSSAGAGSSSEL
jgi:hypothetical protein